MEINRRTVETMSGTMDVLEASSGRYRCFRVGGRVSWACYDKTNLVCSVDSEGEAKKWIAERKAAADEERKA